MEEKLILTIDCGTQSTRVIIFDQNGNILEKSKVEYEPYFQPKPGYAEQDASVFWNATIKGCNEVFSKATSLKDKVCAVGVTTQRDSMVLVDKDGTPLRPVITWLDQRKARPTYRPKGLEASVYKLVGMYESILKTQAEGSCNWLKQNEPENWKKAYKFLQVSGFLNFKLTGRFIDSIASQIGHIPFNYKKQRWAKKGELPTRLFPIESEKLPELVSAGSIVGTVTKEASNLTGILEGTPVIACGSDKGCETLGVGCVFPNSASLSFGTTATVQVTSKKYFEPLSFMPAYPAVFPGYFNPEVEIFRGYWLISWFKREFCHLEVMQAEKEGIAPEVILNKALSETPAGSMGLVVQPFWSPGLKTPFAKGAIIGFGDVHTKKYMYRAVIEGLAFALKDGLKKIEKSGKIKVEKLFVSGGASQADEICQIAADIFKLPIYRGKTYETSSLGAAIICSVAAKIHPTLQTALENMVCYGKVFYPDEKNSQLYEKLYEKVYCQMYKRLSPLYNEIRQITGYPESHS
ncbi:MAG: carbohydrate kinase [Spirochaetales bacterium]|nr:carbohydrate kinase [Spirochaetales bacterium]